MNDESPERRRSPGRREDDLVYWRLEVIEKMLSSIQKQLDEQDTRYDERFITRREIVAKVGSNDWALRIILVVLSTLSLLNVVLK